MNVSRFVKILSLLLLSSVFAASQKLNNFGLAQELNALLLTGAGTLEQVQAIFEKADETFTNDFCGIRSLLYTNDPDIVKCVLPKSANMNLDKRVLEIRDVISQKLKIYKERGIKLSPEDPAFEIIITCLDEIKGLIDPAKSDLLYSEYLQLFVSGNLTLIKKFVEAGFQVPSSFPPWIWQGEPWTVETLKYLVQHGYNMSKEGHMVYDLIDKITLADFQFYLAHGLPLDFICSVDNWLALALEKGRFELAELVYLRGLRLSKVDEAKYVKFQDNIDIFVKRLALSEANEQATKMMKVRLADPESLLNHIPLDIFIDDISKSLYHFALGKIDIYY